MSDDEMRRRLKREVGRMRRKEAEIQRKSDESLAEFIEDRTRFPRERFLWLGGFLRRLRLSPPR